MYSGNKDLIPLEKDFFPKALVFELLTKCPMFFLRMEKDI